MTENWKLERNWNWNWNWNFKFSLLSSKF